MLVEEQSVLVAIRTLRTSANKLTNTRIKVNISALNRLNLFITNFFFHIPFLFQGVANYSATHNSIVPALPLSLPILRHNQKITQIPNQCSLLEVSGKAVHFCGHLVSTNNLQRWMSSMRASRKLIGHVHPVIWKHILLQLSTDLAFSFILQVFTLFCHHLSDEALYEIQEK